jgi:hypothetical protein
VTPALDSIEAADGLTAPRVGPGFFVYSLLIPMEVSRTAGARRSLDRILRQPLYEFVRQTPDDLPAGPIRHTIDPDDEAAGGESAQVVVALDQQYVGAKPRRRRPPARRFQ